MRRLLRRPEPAGTAVSDSERELFGGPLRYDMGWAGHEYATLETSLAATLRMLPELVGGTVRLAWRADRRALVGVGLAELGQGIAGAFGLLAVNAVLREVLVGGDASERLRAALPALVVAGLFAAAGAVLASWSTAAAGRLEPKVERLATERYLHGAVRVEMEAIEDPEFRRLVDVAQYGADSSRRMIGACVAAVNGVVALVAVGGVLASLHPLLLPMLVLIAAPRGWGAMRVAQRRYVSMMQWLEHVRAAKLLAHLVTDREAAPEVRVHGAGRYILDHYRRMAETAEAEQTRLARDKAGTELLAAALSGAAAVATYAVLGALITSGRMELAAAGTAVLAVRSGSAGLGMLVSHVNRLHEEGLYVRDLDRFLAGARERAIPEGGADLPAPFTAVALESVGFSYPERDAPAVSEVSLTVPAGAVVALVGENGSGKSTLAKLLAGLYLPDSGRILWDGVDLAGADRRQVFDRVSLLTQEFERWPFTAAANIRIGRPDRGAASPTLADAAAYCAADEVIEGLPHGMGTLLARQFRGGAELSGGQWQKIGLARTRYRDAAVVIVDEPTSALDPAAEIAVFDRIRTLAGAGRAVVLVTHRMAAVRHADLIYVLHRGRLVERGTHEELLRRDGRYAAMYRIQADQYAPAAAARPRPGGGAGPEAGAGQQTGAGAAAGEEARSPD